MHFQLLRARATGRGGSSSSPDKTAPAGAPGTGAPARYGWPLRPGRPRPLQEGQLCQAEAGPRTAEIETHPALEEPLMGSLHLTGSNMAASEEAPSAAGQAAPCSGGALSLAGQGGKEQEVPQTLHQLLATFVSHPSTLLILAGLAALLHLRAQSPLHPAADAAVAVVVAAGWCVQEWVVHALLLHSKFDWVGRRIHVGHHQRPFFHVSVDDPPIVLGFMCASLALFWLGFGGTELALTAALSYYLMGLLYEFTHYAVHTRYLPRSALGKRIRMHHLLHHTRSEAHWLAFTLPAVDSLFGTNPDPKGVRMSDMARDSLAAGRRRSSGGRVAPDCSEAAAS